MDTCCLLYSNCYWDQKFGVIFFLQTTSNFNVSLCFSGEYGQSFVADRLLLLLLLHGWEAKPKM